VAPSTRPVGTDFEFDVRSDGFAATNAYFLVDGMFRVMESMGFTIAGAGGYFDGTSFPVAVDHRAENGGVNAHCLGDAGGDGVGQFTFGPCVSGTTVGMCTEFQTVAHEFGHALLYDSVHSANFGFCHSAGDSLAVILNDPDSAATGALRFQVFPWCPIGGGGERFCNRDVAGGWAWGGAMDDTGYGSEEILATTLFRVYQVTGGDSAHPDAAVRQATKLQASRYSAYLIFRSIGALATSPVTATPNVGVYATALMNADTGTTSFDGYPGGTHNKVLRWAGISPPGRPRPSCPPVRPRMSTSISTTAGPALTRPISRISGKRPTSGTLRRPIRRPSRPTISRRPSTFPTSSMCACATAGPRPPTMSSCAPSTTGPRQA
jgi:hypothetical protein